MKLCAESEVDLGKSLKFWERRNMEQLKAEHNKTSTNLYVTRYRTYTVISCLGPNCIFVMHIHPSFPTLGSNFPGITGASTEELTNSRRAEASSQHTPSDLTTERETSGTFRSNRLTFPGSTHRMVVSI